MKKIFWLLVVALTLGWGANVSPQTGGEVIPSGHTDVLLNQVIDDIADLDDVVDAGFLAGAKAADLAIVDGIVDDILLDTAEIGAAGAGLTAIPDMAKDSTVAKEATIGAPAGASISADIAAVKTVVDAGSTSAEITALDSVIDAGFLAASTSAEITALDGVIDAGFLAGAKEASLAPLATSAEITALDGVVDAGFLTAATSAEITALDSVVDAGFLAAATSAEIVALDGVIDAGFLAGAKEASLAPLALEATSQSILTNTAEIGVAGAGLSAIPDMAKDSTVAKAADLATTDGKVDGIKTVTDALPTFPSDPADESSIEGAITTAHGTTDGKIDTVDSNVDSLVTMASGNETVSSMSYIDDGGEQIVVTLSPGAGEQWILHGIWIDTDAMTQSGVVKEYYKVDDTNYRKTESVAMTASDEGKLLPLNAAITSDFKITYTEDSDEGAARTIYYQVIYEKR